MFRPAAKPRAQKFRAIKDGGNVSNTAVEKSDEFTLVHWRPVTDRQLGCEAMGIVQAGRGRWTGHTALRSKR